MAFIETKPSRRSILLLLLMGCVTYFLALAVPPLRVADEALQGAFAQDLVAGGSFWETRLYGVSVPGFPLYSWLVALCSLGQMPTEYTLRLPAVLSIFGIALLSGLFARKVHDIYAGFMAAAVVLTSLVSYRVGVRAQSETVAAFLLSTAWYLWFYHGWEKRQWWLGWGGALFMVFLAQFAIGFKALFLFYLPLLFCRSDFHMAERMQAPAHIFSLGILGLLTMVWLTLVPGQPYLPWNAYSVIEPAHSGYFSHFFSMFPKAFFSLFPWTFFSWAPFCPAVRRFEQNPLMCSFLRAIVVSNAVWFWLLPQGSPLHLLPVLGPMAVLIGVYAEIVMCRFKEFWQKLMSVFAWVLLAVSFASICFWSVVLCGWIQIEEYSQFWLKFSLVVSILIFMTTWTQILFSRRRSFRSCFLWNILGYRMLVILLVVIPMAWLQNNRRETGRRLAAELQKSDDVVYLDATDSFRLNQILVETFSLRCAVKSVRDLYKDLPQDSLEWLLLSSRVPAISNCDLEAGIHRIYPGERPYCFWEWNKKEEVLREDAGAEPVPFLKIRRGMLHSEKNPQFLRLYRAVLRQSE